MRRYVAAGYVCVFVSVLIAIYFNPTHFDRRKVSVRGHADDPFHKASYLFRNILRTERGGAALAVLHKGRLVIDQWGGMADPSAGSEWKEQTMAVAYSTSKIFAGLIFSLLKDQESAKWDYDDKVSKFWPKYAAHGKGDTTIRDVLDHKAGLVAFSRDFTLGEALDPVNVSTIIEQSAPKWIPGTKKGYHALTYGFLVDQLVRRLDVKGRSVHQFVEEEIKPFADSNDFYIGVPYEEQYRIARVSDPSLLSSVLAHAAKPLQFAHIMRKYHEHGGLADYAGSFPHIVSVMRRDAIPYNDPDTRTLGLLSSMGIGTARSMAHLVRAAAQRLRPETLELISTPTAVQEDMFRFCDSAHGHGFFYEPHPLNPEDQNIRFLGNGMQLIDWNPKEDIIIVFLRNGLHPAAEGLQEMLNIVENVYRVIGQSS